MTLARKDAVPDIARVIYEKYLGRTGIAPSIYVSRPACGAHILDPGDSS